MNHAESNRRAAVILAAGKGTRLRSRLPKVLHRVGGRPLLGWVIEAAREAGCDPILVVVGHGGEEVRAAFADQGLTWVEQHQQLGTGHAVAQAQEALEQAGVVDATVLVLSGDAPVITAETVERLAQQAEAAATWGAMACAELAQPGSLGRVVAAPSTGEGGGSRLERIVEAADATAQQLRIRRVNAGFYALPTPGIFERLADLDAANAQGEIYLTDAVSAAAADGERVALVDLADPGEALGVNSRSDLARVHQRLLNRKIEALMAAGVTVLDPARTVVEAGVCVGRDTVLHPGVSLTGHTVIGEGCELGQGVWLRDSELADSVTVEPYCVLDRARVASGCRVGPFARLRPASVLLEGARVGNFVEIKNSRLGAGAKAGHLAYLGDATVGAGANIGAGVVTCNYDGQDKHPTQIGGGAFIGSDTMLVAPVTIGEDATTAAGSVTTHDVADGDLAVGRARQRNVPGWAERRTKRRRPNKQRGEQRGRPGDVEKG